jgi:hypothetical protein
LEEDNQNRTVDWRLSDPDTKEELPVELTELSDESADEREMYVSFDTISQRINKYSRINEREQLYHRGRLFKSYISKPVVAELLGKIDRVTAIARKDGFGELVENEMIALAFARKDMRHHLVPWAIKHQVLTQEESELEVSDSSFRGPDLPMNEVKRIKSKIETKKKQFDRKTLNALIIRANRLFNQHVT